MLWNLFSITIFLKELSPSLLQCIPWWAVSLHSPMAEVVWWLLNWYYIHFHNLWISVMFYIFSQLLVDFPVEILVTKIVIIVWQTSGDCQCSVSKITLFYCLDNSWAKNITCEISTCCDIWKGFYEKICRAYVGI